MKKKTVKVLRRPIKFKEARCTCVSGQYSCGNPVLKAYSSMP